MKCYRCGEILGKGTSCPKCGINVAWYREAVRVSDRYYNIGLAKAKVRDLSGALESLKLSVAINKNNIDARNLLGLVYYEMGRVVEALSHWVISKNIRSDRNRAVIYIKNVQSNKSKFDMVTGAIRKYNLALKAVKSGSEDIPILQLKKIVNQYPGFIDAQLLLSLLYIREKDYTRARRHLNAVLKTDRGNVTACSYLQDIEDELHVRKKENQTATFLPKLKDKPTETKPLSGNDVILPRSSYKEPSNGAMTIFTVLAGVALGAALMWFLIMPAKYQGMIAEHNRDIQQYSEQLSDSNVQLNSLTSELNKIKEEKAVLEEQVAHVSGDNGSNRLLTAVIQAANAYIANDKIAAAEAILDIDVSELPVSAAKSLYNTISGDVMQLAANEFYNRGMSAYNSKNYEDGADLFAKACKADSSKDYFVYYAAKCYEALNLTEEAKKYYQTIIDEFRSSSFVAEANRYVSEH